MRTCRLPAMVVWMSVVLCSILPLSAVWAQTVPSLPNAPNPSTIIPPANLLAEAANTVGVKKCRSALTRLGSIGAYGSQQQDILIDWDKQKPDTNPVFSMLGANFPNGAVAVSVIAVPDAAGSGCSVLAERISVAPFTCDSIAQSELVNQKATPLLPRFNVYTDPADPDSTVSLMDSPPGCLIIRRYVKYHWVAPKP